MKDWTELSDEFQEATQDGLVAAFTNLLREEEYRRLVGWLATVYGVTNRKVESIDQRSFAAAKSGLSTYLARTTGWSAKLSRDTRNGRWSRGEKHPDGSLEGRPDPGNTIGVGGRGGGVRSNPRTAPDSPAGTPAEALQRHALKRNCPSCQAAANKVWRLGNRVVCPHCVRRVRSEA